MFAFATFQTDIAYNKWLPILKNHGHVPEAIFFSRAKLTHLFLSFAANVNIEKAVKKIVLFYACNFH